MSDAPLGVVLDTNLLHSLRLYLAYADQQGRYPDPDAEWSGEGAQRPAELEEKSLREGLIAGGRTFHFLKDNDGELVRCPAVELELLRLGALARAQGNAMRSPLGPNRVWTRLDEATVNWWLSVETRQSMVEDIEATFDTLAQEGIQVSELRPSESGDAVYLARQMMTVVYMGTLDSIVYAQALVVGAGHLLTRDGPFRRIVNRMHNPEGAANIAVSESLTGLVEAVTGTPLTYDNFPVSPSTAKLRSSSAGC